jgi:hypothetical protein
MDFKIWEQQIRERDREMRRSIFRALTSRACGIVLMLAGVWMVSYFGPGLRSYQALEDFSDTRMGFSTGVVLIVGGAMMGRRKRWDVMQKWEYCLVVVEVKDLEAGEATLEAGEATLDEFGEGGWEAVQMVPHRPRSADQVTLCLALLKRQKSLV